MSYPILNLPRQHDILPTHPTGMVRDLLADPVAWYDVMMALSQGEGKWQNLQRLALNLDKSALGVLGFL
jgi:hypothetical protein